MIKRFFTNNTAIFFYLITIIILIIAFAGAYEQTDKILEKEEIRSQIKLQEFRYRDNLADNYQVYLKSSSLKIIDSLTLSNKEYYSLKKILIQDFLLQQDVRTFSTNYSKQPFLGVSYDSIKTTIKIKKDELSKIQESIKAIDNVTDLLKYGDILEVKSSLKGRVKFDIIALIIGALLILKLIIDFIIAIRKSRKEKIVYIELNEEIDNLNKSIDNAKSRGESVSVDTLTYLKQQVEELNLKAKPLLQKTNSIEDAKLEAIKLESISKQFFERSNLLLVIAFIIAIVGVFIFYIILPDFSKGYSLNEYLAISIRPVLTLIFFQTLSIFIFKQYRISVSDYKFFNNEYQEKIAFITAHKLLKEEDFSEEQISSVKSFINTTKSFGKDEKEENNDSILQQLKALIKKE